MPERIRERLDDDDTIAAAQILSWIARPHRSASGLSLLLPSEKKPNRVQSQRPAFQKDFLRGLDAGGWFDAKITAHMDPDGESKTLFPEEFWTTRKMAERSVSKLVVEKSNAIKRMWSNRKQIAHLASAVRQTLLDKFMYDPQPKVPRPLIYAHLRPFTSTTRPRPDLPDLEPRLFVADPDWVQDVIHEAERRLALACEVGAFDAAGFVQFHRDNF